MPQTQRISRIHIDAIGGLAGDMFVAALLDAFPERTEALLAVLNGQGLPEKISVQLREHRDEVLVGRRFTVETGERANDHHGHQHHHGHHHHRAYRDIRRLIDASTLTSGARCHAHAMFRILAEAEGAVHGVAPDDVEFHEVGAVDSIVDFFAAAWLIDDLSPAVWTFSPLPLGGGRIDTAHGVLPVPAPAAALLLRGLQVIDDGIGGERVTPTGAAIASYLYRLSGGSAGETSPEIVLTTGFGFGERALSGLANVTRCLAFAASPASAIRDRIATIQFEIDDQPAEDLAVALDRVRACPGVLEVYQAPLFGKKGRMVTQVQILAETTALEAVTELCLEETTTLGLRVADVARRKLFRKGVAVGDPPVRVKLARRPWGRVTAKAEISDLAAEPGGREARAERRHAAELKAVAEALQDENE